MGGEPRVGVIGAGVIGLDDPLRDEAKGMVRALRELGVRRVLLVSGDRKRTADSVGLEVGVDQVFADCKPEQKLQILTDEMRSATGTVIAVGDGINDAPALAAATVGVAMGARGATAASEAADVVIVEDSIEHLADAIDVAQGARSRALQAAGVGMTLATAAMLLGAFGQLCRANICDLIAAEVEVPEFRQFRQMLQPGVGDRLHRRVYGTRGRVRPEVA